jgi:hypothetical protein
VKPWHIVFPEARTRRALAACRALGRAGAPVFLWNLDQSHCPPPKLGVGDRAIIVDYDPVSGLFEEKWQGAECLFVHCAGFVTRNSRDIATWVDRMRRPHLWESIPSHIADCPYSGTIIFPAWTPPDPDPVNPCRASGIPVVGVLRELHSHQTMRRIQQEYLATPPGSAELFFFVESSTARDLHNRAAGVAFWYVPGPEEGRESPWSQELTNLLFAGSRIAARRPPPVFAGHVDMVNGLGEMLGLAGRGQEGKTADAALFDRIDQAFAESVTVALEKRQNEEIRV